MTSSIPRIRPMDDAITRLLRAAGIERAVHTFEPVLVEGSDADLLFVVHAGELLATVGVPGGERIVAEYGPGTWFGSVDGVALATVAATRPSRITVVEGARLDDLLDGDGLAAGAIRARLDTARWARMRVLGDTSP